MWAIQGPSLSVQFRMPKYYWFLSLWVQIWIYQATWWGKTIILIKTLSRVRKKTFYLKFIKGLPDSSKLIKTKSIIKKYIKYFKRGYSTQFADSAQNKITGISNRKFFRKKMFKLLKCKGAKTSYGEFPSEFAPEASKIPGLKLNTK
jgi:hypothetical protein